MGFEFDQRSPVSRGNTTVSGMREPGRGKASWQLPAVNASQSGARDGKAPHQTPQEWEKSQFRRDLEASMEIDRELLAEVGTEEWEYIRTHLLRVGLGIAAGVGIGLLLTGPIAAALFSAGVLYRVWQWIAAVLDANGNEVKLQAARKAFVRVLEALVMAGVVAALKMVRTGGAASAEERQLAVVQPQRSTNVPATTSAGQELTKALDGPDANSSVTGSSGPPLISGPGGALQNADEAMSGSVPIHDFVPLSQSSFQAIKAMKTLSPAARWNAFQQIVRQELHSNEVEHELFDVPAPVFEQGKYSRFSAQRWVLEFPRHWMTSPIDDTTGASIAAQLTRRMNEVFEYWSVVASCAYSPTLRGLVLRGLPAPLVREAERRYAMGLPLPIKDPDRLNALIAVLPSHVEWPTVRQELATARREYAEPTINPMISAAEGGHLTELQEVADIVKWRMKQYSNARGSTRASQWARQQYALPSAGQRARVSPVPRALRHDNLEFDSQYYHDMQLLQTDWHYEEVDRPWRLQEVLNAQLVNWGVPKFKVVAGPETKVDLENWQLIVAEGMFLPGMARDFGRVHEMLAYNAVKIVQQWKMLKWRLVTLSPEQLHSLKIAPGVIAAARNQANTMTPEEIRRARTLYEGIVSGERVIANHTLQESYAELMKAQSAVNEALEAADLSDPAYRDDANVEQAFSEYEEALRRHEHLSTAFSQRPEEDEALEAMQKTLLIAKTVAQMNRLGAR